MIISDKFIADKMAIDRMSGYWHVNGKFFFSKIDSLKYASEIRSNDVKYSFFDEFFDSLNWGLEPLEDIKTLYRRRAEQLRSKYDYIIVAFSGGADSTTVIDSFLENGIHLDEIATSYPIKAGEKLYKGFNPLDKSSKNLMFEYFEATKPKLDKVRQRFPKTKITVLDHTDSAVDLILSNKLHVLPAAGFGAAPSLAALHMIGERVREISETTRNVCFLIGNDKPRIGYNIPNKKFGIYFDDVSTCWGHHTEESLSGFHPTVEYFYYNLDVPELLVKQAHNIVNAVKPLVEENNNFYLHEYNDLYTRNGNNIVFRVHHNFFKKILYPDWDVNIFQAGKPSSFFFQESAYWFTNTELTDQRTKDYHVGQVIDSCANINDSMIVKNRLGIPLKFMDISTRAIALPI